VATTIRDTGKSALGAILIPIAAEINSERNPGLPPDVWNNFRTVIAGLEPAIHLRKSILKLDGCPDQVRA
jgi:hypothetical protein